MRYLITGGTGFIGSNLADALEAENHEVICTGKAGENPVDYRVISYAFNKLPWDALGPIDCLFHLAACTDTMNQDWRWMRRVNLTDSLDLFSQATAHGVPRIVYASSCAVYGSGPVPFRENQPAQPLNCYAQSKYQLDVACDWAQPVPVVGLRFSNVYGCGEEHKGASASMVSRLLWQMREGNPKLFRDGTQARDWVFVADVVEALKLACHQGQGVYNIGAGQSVSFNALVAHWNELLGTERQPTYIDNPHEGAYQSLTSVDISKAERELGYKPKYQIRDGLNNYLARLQSE